MARRAGQDSAPGVSWGQNCTQVEEERVAEWRCPSGHVVPGAADFDMWCPGCGTDVIAFGPANPDNEEVKVTDSHTEAEAARPEIPVPLGEKVGKPKLAAALAAFQAEVPRVVKGSKADIQPREGRAYTYEYAELGAVNEAVLPVLGKHGLSFLAKPTWVSRPDSTMSFCLIYKLMHSSGEQEVGLWPLPPPDRATMQSMGSAITYARRYAFQAITGVAPAPGEDDDGKAAGDGPLPDAVHPVPSGPRMADEVQRRRISNRLTEMGIADNEEMRMGWVSGVRGVYTAALDDLTREDAQGVLERLKPASRQARNQVIEALKSIGITEPPEVIAKLAEWTARDIGSTSELCMAEAESVQRKAATIKAEREAQDKQAELPADGPMNQGPREEIDGDKPADA